MARPGSVAEARLSWAIGTTDGLSCFVALTEAGCVNIPRVVGALRLREFKWVSTMLGYFKTMLAGTFHALKYRKYAQVYQAAFTYCFK